MRKPIVLVMSLVLIGAAALPAAEEGLVGSWRFDRPGPRIEDLSGRGHAAELAGGSVAKEEDKAVLACDGRQRIGVPAHPDFDLQRGFTLETRFRASDFSNGRAIVFRDGQYSLRVDWPSEGSKLSLFVFADGQWEPRVSAFTLDPASWYHVAATWDGTQAALWVNGELFQVTRRGKPPGPSDGPLVLCSSAGHGGGLVGGLDYVKIFRRALSPAEIIQRAFGLSDRPGPAGTPSAAFDFRQGIAGWTAGRGAAIAAQDGKLVVRSRLAGGIAIHNRLQAGVDKRDFLSLRMAVDRGSRGEVIFATTRGAGRIPFPTLPDGQPHTYVLEPWTWPGWGGELVALAIVPSEIENATARIEYLRVTEELQAEPEVRIDRVFTESTLPRADRPETIVARVRNAAGPASGLVAALAVPEGVTIQGAAVQEVPAVGFLQQKEVAWQVRAAGPASGPVRVTVSGAGIPQVAATEQVAFHPNPRLGKAGYVPEPVPAQTGKYTLWTHYCPLWKHGTHMGWKAIEPYPERKPVLGWYNEGDPELADWHIKYWREHGITGVVYCWYRSSRNAPVQQNLGHAIHDGLLKARYLSQIKFAIMWENGCGQGVGSADDLMHNVLPFWIENYFSHPSYQRVDGKPLLYIWVPPNVTRDLGGSESVRKTFDRMRAVCREKGLGGLYLVGCVGSQDRQVLATMAKEGWDASSAYGNGWTPPPRVRTVGDFVCAPIDGFFLQQEALWRFKSQCGLLPDVTAAMMGWDSRPWHETAFFWSENTPQKFRELCLKAKALIDSGATTGPGKNTLIFCCFNEFGEGHYIEPTRGYGFEYLDVIREVFGDGPKGHADRHLDLAPEDVALGPYDSWYQTARKLLPAAGGASTETSWSGEKLGAWTGMMGLDQVAVAGGVLRAVSVNPDPAFSSPALKLRASRATKVIVSMRASKPGWAQLFWTTTSSPMTSEAASRSAAVTADGRFHEVTFPVGTSEHWGGCVTSMRFDPIGAEGTRIEIRSIRVE